MDAVRHQATGSSSPYLLQIYAPRRHGKSEYWSHWAPAWYLARFPDKHIIVCSHTGSLAQEFGRKARDSLERHGLDDFGVKVNPRSSARGNWSIQGYEGGLFTIGVGGALPGRGADLLIIDDPVKGPQEAASPVDRAKVWNWWIASAYGSLAPSPIVVLMQTRWHQDDLAGRINAQALESGRKWRVISFPAIAEEDDPLDRQPGEALWPARYPIERLNEIRQDVTPYWWGAMYQQHPGSYGELCWPEDYFSDIWADEHEWPDKFGVSAIFIDPALGKNAKKGDFSAMAFMGIANHKLWVDIRLSRIPLPQVVEEALDWYTEKSPSLFACEGVTFQELVAHEINRRAAERGLLGFQCSAPIDLLAKERRIERLSPHLARHEIKIRNTPGGRELYRQLREFPQCDHDDGPDAAEGALRVLGNIGQYEHVIGRAGA